MKYYFHNSNKFEKIRLIYIFNLFQQIYTIISVDVVYFLNFSYEMRYFVYNEMSNSNSQIFSKLCSG